MVFTKSLLREIQKPMNFQTVPVIVELKPDAKVNAIAPQISQALGVDVGQVIPFVNAFSMVIPTAMLGELSSFKDIQTIHFDRPMYAFAPPPLLPPPDPLGLFKTSPEAIAQKVGSFISNPNILVSAKTGWIPTSEANKLTRIYDLHTKNIMGQGVKVWVLDTGVDISNPQLQGVIAGAHSSTLGAPNDGVGHGTWCASRIVGQLYTHPVWGFELLGGAPECELYTCKVLTDLGVGNTSDILKGMQMALDNQADIISMSLGGDGSIDEEEDLMVKFINKAAQTNPRTIFVIAAGNSGAEGEKAGKTIGIPACAEKAVTVGAWSILDNARAYYSSTGPTLQAGRIKPDIMADGGGRAIASGYPSGQGDIYSGSAFGSQLDPLDKLVDGFCPLKGTCLKGSTLVYRNPDKPERIDSLKPGETVYSINTENGMIERHKITAIMCNGTKQLYKITVGGKQIECTENHPLLVAEQTKTEYYRVSPNLSKKLKLARKQLNISSYKLSKMIGVRRSTYQTFEDSYSGTEQNIVMNVIKILNISIKDGDLIHSNDRIRSSLKWKETKNIKVGDIIVTIKNLPEPINPTTNFNGIPITKDLCQIMGFLIGDGWLTHNISRQQQSYQIGMAAGIYENLNKQYSTLFEKVFGKPLKMYERGHWFYCYSKEIWMKLQSLGLDAIAHDKEVPNWIFNTSKKCQQAFLQGYLDSDGTENNQQYLFESASEKLIRGIHQLLIMNNYRVGKVRDRERIVQPPGSPNPVKSHTWLTCSGKTPIKHGCRNSNKGIISLPIDMNIFATQCIKSIEPTNKELVYDIEVEGAHNFIAEGIVVHNSMATPSVASVIILWKSLVSDLTSDDVKSIFAKFGQPKTNEMGFGLIDATWILRAMEGT